MAAELFPRDSESKGLELLVEGLYGPHSRRWVKIRQVWRGSVEGRLGDPEANVNFSLMDVGWIQYPFDAEIETRIDIRA